MGNKTMAGSSRIYETDLTAVPDHPRDEKKIYDHSRGKLSVGTKKNTAHTHTYLLSKSLLN